MPQKIDDLLEGRMLYQIVHVEATVEKTPLASVDETNFRRRNDDILEASLELAAHTLPSPRSVENGFFYHRSRAPSRHGPVDILDFYDRHPISEEQVLAAVARRRGGMEGTLGVDDLFEFDQDHYGGLAAVEALAERALITAASRTLDFGAGLGGPARFLASRRACRVVALEVNANRVAGGVRLTRRVGLAGRVWLIRGDAQQLPFADSTFDACISQETLLHIADKTATLAGCRRVLRPGGRLAFTRLDRASSTGGSRARAAPRVDGRHQPADTDQLSAPAAARWLCVDGGGRPQRRVANDTPAKGRPLPQPSRGHGGPAGRGALSRVRPALHVPHHLGRPRQAGERTLLGRALIRGAAIESA